MKETQSCYPGTWALRLILVTDPSSSVKQDWWFLNRRHQLFNQLYFYWRRCRNLYSSSPSTHSLVFRKCVLWVVEEDRNCLEKSIPWARGKEENYRWCLEPENKTFPLVLPSTRPQPTFKKETSGCLEVPEYSLWLRIYPVKISSLDRPTIVVSFFPFKGRSGRSF